MSDNGEFYRDYWMQAVKMWQMKKNPSDCVQALVDVVTPLVSPQFRDWLEVERRLGTRLPSDYKRVVDLYGPGEFLGLRLFVPDAPGDEFNLDTLVAKVQRRAQQYRDEVRPRVSAPYFPQDGGLIPWGENGEGDYFFWCPFGDDPDWWPVMIADVSWGAYYLPHRSVSGYLSEYLTPPIGRVSGMGADLPDLPGVPKFIPAS